MKNAKILYVLSLFFGFIATSLILPVLSRASIINIDATHYGFHYPGLPSSSNPAPAPGTVVVPITNPSGLPLNQLTLGAGTYTVSNASGLQGANPNFTAWDGNIYSTGTTWGWNFVIVDDFTKQVVLYGEAGVPQTSQAAVASQSSVQNFSSTFILANATTLDFMVRDWLLTDNTAGVTLNINMVPIPGSAWLFGIGLLGLAPLRIFRKD